MSKLMRVIRYNVFPMTLYRIQPSLPVKLRDYDTQTKLGRTSFDLKLHDGLVLPTTKDTFEGPNGMSLRPDGRNFERIIRDFRGEPVIYSIIGGTATPDGLVLLYEHTDHYSLQVSRPMPLPEFNERLTEFLKLCPTMTRENYLKGLEDENFDN